jgi:inner membrane protease ATP23
MTLSSPSFRARSLDACTIKSTPLVPPLRLAPAISRSNIFCDGDFQRALRQTLLYILSTHTHTHTHTHAYTTSFAQKMSNPETAPDGASLTAMTAAPPPKKLDPIYYNWSSTFSILLGRMTQSRDVELENKYFTEMDELKADSICKRCEDNRSYLLQYSPIVRFLKDEVAKLGGDLNDKNILCRMCTNEQSGGFSLDHGILLCANKFRNRGHQEDTMAHEMVHAWDHLKFKVENENLRHQACLEIRASTLSGECRFSREFFTKNQWRITEQLQHCVRRRATLSMMARPGVKDETHAGEIVNQVWEG